MKAYSIHAVKFTFTLLALFLTTLLSAQTAKISVQGVLKLSDGSAVEDDDYMLNFKLFDASTGGTMVHNEDVTTAVTGGVYSVVLGEGTPLTAAFDVPYYLEIKIGSEILAPRLPLTAAPSALSLIGSGNKFPGSGNVGVGTTSPNNNLSVIGNLSVGTNSAAPANGLRVQGSSNLNTMTVAGSATFQSTVDFQGDTEFDAIGIGTSSVTSPLTFQNTSGAKITLNGNGNSDHYGFGVSSGQLNYHVINSSGAHVFYSSGNNGSGTELMRIEGSGDIGVGTVGNNGADATFNIRSVSGGSRPIFNVQTNAAQNLFSITNNKKVTIHSGGYMEIQGSNNASTAPLQVNGYDNQDFASYGLINEDPPVADHIILQNTHPISIRSTHAMAATQFISYSDARIKKVIGRSNSMDDLETISKLKITDYTHIDKVSKGNRVIKKVIAQELEAVYPQAVSKTTDVVPDIYQMASIEDGRVSLANDLKAGDRIKLIFEDNQEIFEVLAADAAGFSIESTEQGMVFVYGREVDDFRVVDYDALSTLNISATQELLKMLREQQQINARQQDQLSQLQGQLNSLSSLVQGLKEQEANNRQTDREGTATEK